MTQSNLHGMALEYIIVDTLFTNLSKKGALLTPRSIITQKRDLVKFDSLSNTEKDEYLKYSKLVFKWFDNKFGNLKGDIITIDRISDNEAVAGDVTDIRISIVDEIINLSIKHNHFALKHQRPPSLAIQCGFTKNSKEDILFRESLNKINNSFHLNRNKLAPNVSAFNKLKEIDVNFIENNLYKPTCIAVIDFINNHTNPFLSKSLFLFLVGNKNFYKIIASKGSVEIKEFADILIPKKVEASLVANSYVRLIFSNDWIIKMRLHTASTKISNTPSLKFDTQVEKMNIPEAVIY